MKKGDDREYVRHQKRSFDLIVNSEKKSNIHYLFSLTYFPNFIWMYKD
jgi:hypothetical protein